MHSDQACLDYLHDQSEIQGWCLMSARIVHTNIHTHTHRRLGSRPRAPPPLQKHQPQEVLGTTAARQRLRKQQRQQALEQQQGQQQQEQQGGEDGAAATAPAPVDSDNKGVERALPSCLKSSMRAESGGRGSSSNNRWRGNAGRGGGRATAAMENSAEFDKLTEYAGACFVCVCAC